MDTWQKIAEGQKKQDNRKYYKYNKVGHIAKDCRSEQKIKNCSIQDKTYDEKDNKQKDLKEGSK